MSERKERTSETKAHQKSVRDMFNKLEADRNRVKVTAGRTMKGKSVLSLLKQLEQTERLLFMIETVLQSTAWKERRPSYNVSPFYKRFGQQVETDWRRVGVLVKNHTWMLPGIFVACHGEVNSMKNWMSAEISERVRKGSPVLIRMYHTRKASIDKYGAKIKTADKNDRNLSTSPTTSTRRNPLSSQGR